MPPRVPSPSPNKYYAGPAPFTAPVSGDIEQRLAQLAEAINGKADKNGASTFAWIRLTASDGSVWAVSVDTNGNLHTTKVLRPP